jgi:glycosyltransferase involved in cell wall biosynthesis
MSNVKYIIWGDLPGGVRTTASALVNYEILDKNDVIEISPNRNRGRIRRFFNVLFEINQLRSRLTDNSLICQTVYIFTICKILKFTKVYLYQNNFLDYEKPIAKVILLLISKFMSQSILVANPEIFRDFYAYLPPLWYRKSKQYKKYAMFSKKAIVMCGRSDPVKRFQEAICMFESSTLPNEGFELQLFTDNPLNFNSTSSAVTVKKFNEESYFSALNQARYSLLPSRTEAFGISILEAMSYGCVCFGFDVAKGLRYVLSDSSYKAVLKNFSFDELSVEIFRLEESLESYEQASNWCISRERHIFEFNSLSWSNFINHQNHVNNCSPGHLI